MSSPAIPRQRTTVEVLARSDGQFEVRHNGIVIHVGSKERALIVARDRTPGIEPSLPSDATWHWLSHRA